MDTPKVDTGRLLPEPPAEIQLPTRIGRKGFKAPTWLKMWAAGDRAQFVIMGRALVEYEGKRRAAAKQEREKTKKSEE